VFRPQPPAPGKTAWIEEFLYVFGPAPDGANPFGGVIEGPDRDLFGTTVRGGTHNAGTIFRLTPPTVGQTTWNDRIIHNFRSHIDPDGNTPMGSLVRDSAGALYGTVPEGGTQGPGIAGGLVFQLAPPPSGTNVWTYTVLHSFDRFTGDGSVPTASLLLRPDGNLYGTTRFGGLGRLFGTVFRLTPPAAPGDTWTETVIYRFHGGLSGKRPTTGLTQDPGGPLFGTTSTAGAFQQGTVFMIKP
jgi:uncharacterized repeat protein (TIGR03803 family)